MLNPDRHLQLLADNLSRLLVHMHARAREGIAGNILVYASALLLMTPYGYYKRWREKVYIYVARKASSCYWEAMPSVGISAIGGEADTWRTARPSL